MAPRQGKMLTCHFKIAVSCNLEWLCNTQGGEGQKINDRDVMVAVEEEVVITVGWKGGDRR